jgi:hypothetical protein
MLEKKSGMISLNYRVIAIVVYVITAGLQSKTGTVMVKSHSITLSFRE